MTADASFEEATFARHRIILPSRTSLMAHVAEQDANADEEANLAFEVFACFEDKEDAITAIGRLPMAAVLAALGAGHAEYVSVRSRCLDAERKPGASDR